MFDVRVLNDTHYDAFVLQQAHAYPGMKVRTPDELQRLKEQIFKRLQDRRVRFYGAFDGDELVGSMRLHDYTMNLRGAMIPTGGVGAVAVDLLRKRERVCGDLIRFYLEKCRADGVPMAVLWPFRPDFYRKMGFGYGGVTYNYAVEPESLPQGPSKEHLRSLTIDDLPAVTDCYNRYFERGNGLLDETIVTWRHAFEAGARRFVGYETDGQLRGFMTFVFAPVEGQSWLVNDLNVMDFFYDSPEVLAEFMTFLHSQRDQIRRVKFETADPDLHYLLGDPRDDSGALFNPVNHQYAKAAVGAMYRIVDPERLFAMLPECRFGRETIALRITAEDAFFTGGDIAVTVVFADGYPQVGGEAKAEAEIRLDIADLSSLVVGAVPFRRLYRYGRVALSDSGKTEQLDRLFGGVEMPYCRTPF